MNIIYYILFVIEVIIFVYLEKKKWHTLLTPTNVLSITYLIVTTIAIIYSNFVPGIKEFYMPSLMIWGLGLLFFFLPSRLFKNNNTTNGYVIIKRTKNNDMYKFMLVFTTILVILSLIRIKDLSISYGIGSDDFSDNYGSNGIYAHITIFLMFVIGYLILKIDKQHKYSVILTLFAIFVMFIQSVKTRIMAPFLITIFSLIISGKIKISWKLITSIAGLAYSFFFLTYFVMMFTVGGDDISSFNMFIINHFLLYLLGGTLSFSLDYSSGIVEPNLTSAFFNPFIIIINKFLPSPINIEVDNPIMLDMGEIGSTNVRTLFGTLYSYSDSLVFLIIFSFFFSLYIYNTYSLFFKKRDIFLLLAVSSDLTFLVFGGFFDMYWMHIYPYEIVVLCLLLSFLSKIKINVKDFTK